MGFGKQGTGVIIREHVAVALGTIGNNAVVKTTSLVIEEDFRILKSEIFARVDGLTATEGEGLKFGMANGELTVAEIAEAIENDGPVDRNDASGNEQAMRKVDLLADGLHINIAETELKFFNPEGGLKITNKLRWTYSDPEGWTFFVHNAQAALTTGATLDIVATHYGVWVT